MESFGDQLFASFCGSLGLGLGDLHLVILSFRSLAPAPL